MISRNRHAPAFTVIELLVAVTIAVVLAGLLIVVTRSTLDLWQKVQNHSTANIQAKVALDLISRDLKAVIYRESGEATLAVDIVSVEKLQNHNWRVGNAGPSKPDTVNILEQETDTSGRFVEASRFGRGGVWLRFLTTNVRSGGNSGPAIVGYQINRRPTSGSVNANNPPAVRYTLFRQFLDPDETFAAGYDADASDDDLDAPGSSDALCDNVVDFGVWCYRRDNNGSLTPLYPASSQDRSFREAGNQFPSVIDVMLRVMTESGAAQLEQMEAGLMTRPSVYVTDEDWWWGVVNAESRVYTTRVLLEGGGES